MGCGWVAGSTDSQLALALAELSTLRHHCATWRHRAESHVLGTNALLSLARTAKDCALRMRAERDAERSRPDSEFEECGPTTRTESKSRAGDVVPPPRTGLPVYLLQMQCKPVGHFYDNPADAEASHFGPPHEEAEDCWFSLLMRTPFLRCRHYHFAEGRWRYRPPDSIFVTSKVGLDALPLIAAGVAR
ncbi:hypothetical protein B0H16DRAFT_1891540 [Mycena metata]|uniref:Uncharacterized protein n=1 Tax=Mycena metata TaxID=1033252 RepID=A0AAD7I8V6_9AGAR|nr:hypothetical protein B0H16DRAFT_1891540 [Mycena metata]